MSAVRECRYRDCYYNDNFAHVCLKDVVTVGATGVCENIMHCDEYTCSDCEQFDVCDKKKKHDFLSGDEG